MHTQTPPAHVPGMEMARASLWLRANAIMLAAVALIAVSLWWKAGLLSHSYFRLDDYYYLERASRDGFTWKYVMWVDAGHLTPIGSALAWLLVKISPVDWTLTSAATLALLAVTCLALLRMLRTLFGDHPAILMLLMIYLLSPLSLSGLSWWAVTLEMLPLQLAIFCAVTAHVKYLRSRSAKHAASASAWLFVGLASSFRGAGIPLLLLALTSAFFADGSWPRAARATLRDHWRVWLSYLVITAAYAVLYVRELATSAVAPGRPGAFAGVFNFASTLIRDTFIPGILGGPWRWLGVGVAAGVDPPADLVRISWVVFAAVVIVSILYNTKAWRAWVILLGWLTVVDIVPVALGRANFLPGSLLGLVARYVWDAVGITVLCAGLAFLPLIGRAAPVAKQVSAQRGRLRISRPLRNAVACLFTAIAIGSVWSSYNYPADPGAALGRSYIATARIALSEAPHGTVIVNDPLPREVVGAVFFGPTPAAGVLKPLISGKPGTAPRFVTQPAGTYDHLMEFDGWGRLLPAVVTGSGSFPLAKGRSCLRAPRTGAAVIPLRAAVTKANIVRLGYLAGSAGQVLVEFGQSAVLYSVQRGLHAAYLSVQGSGRIITVVTIKGRMPCIGDAEVGVLLPSGTAQAMPPLAVSG